MRIAIDARMMGAETTRGIGRYIQELVSSMLEIAPENKYVLIVKTADHVFKSHPSVETIVADISWYGLQEQIKMPRIFASAKAEVVFVPHWNVPFFYYGPIVITIHDLLLRHFSQSAKASTRNPIIRLIKRLGYRLILANATKKAKKILVPTEFAAKDVAFFYPQVASKIVVTGEGMPEIGVRGTAYGVRSSAEKALLQHINHPPSTDYLLYVGAAYPHKGLQDLLQAWKKISENHQNLILKIAGEMDIFMKQHELWVKSHGLKRVEFLGRISDQTLKSLYEQAVSLIFPSYFEGFGLPPLEAIACGCPVVSSCAASMPEVIGDDGAIFFQAGSLDGIISAIEKVLADPVGAREKALKTAQVLALRHDWKIAAEKTLHALESVR